MSSKREGCEKVILPKGSRLKKTINSKREVYEKERSYSLPVQEKYGFPARAVCKSHAPQGYRLIKSSNSKREGCGKVMLPMYEF